MVDVRSVQRSAQCIAESIAGPDDVDALEATAVTALVALARLGVEGARDELEAFDLVRGQHRAGKTLRQQTRVVVVEHRQVRAKVAVGEYGVRQAHLQR